LGADEPESRADRLKLDLKTEQKAYEGGKITGLSPDSGCGMANAGK
jgi:hypothetical protein